MNSAVKYDAIVIGAGAAGMMCAWEAGKRGRKVAILEHTNKIGEKIRISGGGRCNFTNLYSGPVNFLSQNPHFCKSALSRFGPHDFVAIMRENDIAFHEKPYEEKDGNENARGQLFCNDSAVQIIELLRIGCIDAGVKFHLSTRISSVEGGQESYTLKTDKGDFLCESLVVACGGLSIPKIGASSFGYDVAKSFGHTIVDLRPALVPLTFHETLLEKTKLLSGLSVDAYVKCNEGRFREGLLFTHRGLSGPSILQVSSYWREGDEIVVDFAPECDVVKLLAEARKNRPKQMVRTVLSDIMPVRLSALFENMTEAEGKVADLSNAGIQNVSNIVKSLAVSPSGSEGYRTAEVTLGGVDTKRVSSKTFESSISKGLYFVGEVLDVTGHLGGHNFQWAWSSGWCAGQYV